MLKSSGNEEEARRLGYTPDEYREIVGAERIRGERGERLTPDQLQESAAELGITKADLEEAEAQLRAERQQETAKCVETQRRLRLDAMVAACVLAFVLLISVFTANGLNGRLAAVSEARANLQSALQRKADVLADVRSTLGGTLARDAVDLKSGDLQRQLRADDESRKSLGGETLRANEALAATIEGAENRINVARSRYSAAARQYNEMAGGFPARWIAAATRKPAQLETYAPSP
jgi:hypothetical protein